jgi:hypothetical protein
MQYITSHSIANLVDQRIHKRCDEVKIPRASSWIEHPFRVSIYLSIYLSIYVSAVLVLDLGILSSLLILYTELTTALMWDQPVARPLTTHRSTQTHNKRRQIFMSWVGFEPTITAFERTKTVHTFDRAATVIDIRVSRSISGSQRGPCCS